ncbi:structural maintenance of chromosomes protein 1A-like [Schistocerca americana]|uniref:structural maintenance of chromosomes protein 1A-like n=1 Tax=Schistocerca americana TaxID=7009 RepID=UPI001F4FFC09|nr:structural maintenance of chromosomes protein 1A-like [Schistocerca americana]
MGEEIKNDTEDVTKEEYLSQLKDLGISEYFFIFQGASQDFATKKPKEHTSLLEAISGSVSFKEEYDNLNNQLQDTLETLSSLRAQKKIVDSELKNLKSKLDDAAELEEIQLALKEKKLKLMLLKLYYNCKNKNILISQQDLKVQQLSRLEQEDTNDVEELRKLKYEHQILSENLIELRNEEQLKENEYKDLHSKIDKVRMNLEVLKDKISDNRKQLKRARNVDEKCQYQVSALQDAINELMRELQELEERTPSEADLHHLTDEKVQEYCRLKSLVEVQAAEYFSKLRSLEDEQARDQKITDDEVSSSYREKKKLQECVLRSKQLEDRHQQFSEHLWSVEERIGFMKNKLRETVSEETQELKKRELLKKLAVIDAALLDVNFRKQDENKRDLIRKLQSLFPGVSKWIIFLNIQSLLFQHYLPEYGRVVDLCSPINDEYKIAVTRVIGNKMDAIVVATARTAIQCVGYLREQRLRETFLPLDNLDPKDYHHLLHNKPFIRQGELLLYISSILKVQLLLRYSQGSSPLLTASHVIFHYK